MLFRRKRVQDFDRRIPLVASRKMTKYEKVYFFMRKCTLTINILLYHLHLIILLSNTRDVP
jgi:hypothetical protein